MRAGQASAKYSVQASQAGCKYRMSADQRERQVLVHAETARAARGGEPLRRRCNAGVGVCVCVWGELSALDVLSTVPVTAYRGSHTHARNGGVRIRAARALCPKRVILSQCLSRSQCAMSDTFTPVYVCMCVWVSQCVCGCEVMNAAVYVCGSGKGWRKEVLPGRSAHNDDTPRQLKIGSSGRRNSCTSLRKEVT